MTYLHHAFAIIWAASARAMLRGIGLSILVLVMGAALLGVSGWFITAAASAGLAGIGIAFDVFRPSAAVRLLALGRAAARYGERLLTHDATLRGLEALRIDVLRRQLAAPFATLGRLRPGPVLTRVLSDVDALDGMILRLVVPAVAWITVLTATGLMLGWLVHWGLALWVLILFGGLPIPHLLRLTRQSARPSIRAERTAQALRVRTIDLLRTQRDAIVMGRLAAQRRTLERLSARLDLLFATLDRIDRTAERGLHLLGLLAVVGAMTLGSVLVEWGTISPALAAIAVFVCLALPEGLVPLRRGVGDVGRMMDAARRLFDTPAAPIARTETPTPPAVSGTPLLRVHRLGYQRSGAASTILSDFSLSLEPGQTVALTGRSGAGKSTLLSLLAGMDTATHGQIYLRGRPLAHWSETALRDSLCLVPQRSALVAGTVIENLRLADPELGPPDAWAALRAVALEQKITALGGMDAYLGEGGTGLSGGETRRLVLARAILRRPMVLLLDEPTEGLDAPTAKRVLAGVRTALPDAAILIAAHRPAERACADRIIRL